MTIGNQSRTCKESGMVASGRIGRGNGSRDGIHHHHHTKGGYVVNRILTGVVICASFATSGCANTMLVKDGYTPEQFETDKFDCEQRVVTMYGGYAQMGVGHAVLARQDILRCMKTKGYREASAEERGPRVEERSPRVTEKEATPFVEDTNASATQFLRYLKSKDEK